MKNNAPSKKVYAVMLLMALLVGGVILGNAFIKSLPEKKSANKERIDLVIQNALEKSAAELEDVDGDGLLAWQESLWGTDPNNPDSDSDGTDDFTEIQENRNPLVKGPDDKNLSDSELFDKMIENSDIETLDDNSLTSFLSKELLMQYADAKNKLGELTLEDSQYLAEGLVDQIVSRKIIPEKYSDFVFITIENPEDKDLENYSVAIIESYVNLALSLPRQNDDLLVLADFYEKVARSFSGIKVPKEILQIHKKITNNFYYVSEIMKNLNNYQKDPLLSLLSMSLYRDISQEQGLLFEQITLYLENSGIILDEEDET